MKVTALIPDDLIEAAMKLSKSATITDTLKTALTAYIRMKKVRELADSLVNEPLEFKYTAEELRMLNRK